MCNLVGNALLQLKCQGSSYYVRLLCISDGKLCKWIIIIFWINYKICGEMITSFIIPVEHEIVKVNVFVDWGNFYRSQEH